MDCGKLILEIMQVHSPLDSESSALTIPVVPCDHSLTSTDFPM